MCFLRHYGHQVEVSDKFRLYYVITTSFQIADWFDGHALIKMNAYIYSQRPAIIISIGLTNLKGYYQ